MITPLSLVPLLFFLLLSAAFVRSWCVTALTCMNPFSNFFVGQLRSTNQGGRFQPQKRGCCSILCYLWWLSIVCELLVLSRFIGARYGDWETMKGHYLFDPRQSEVLNLWDDDMTITYTTLGDGTGKMKVNKPMPFDLKLPRAITQNMIDLSHSVDLRYNYYYDPDDASRLTVTPVVRFQTQKQYNQQNDKSSNISNKILLLLSFC